MSLSDDLLFSNFQFIPIIKHTTNEFLAVYIILNVAFYGLLIFMYAIAESFFKLSLNEELKEAKKAIVKIASTVMSFYLFIM